MSAASTRLTAASGAALITASVMVATVRGDITAERYRLARSEQELARVERRSRWIRVDFVATFGRWNPTADDVRGRGSMSLEALDPDTLMDGWQP